MHPRHLISISACRSQKHVDDSSQLSDLSVVVDHGFDLQNQSIPGCQLGMGAPGKSPSGEVDARSNRKGSRSFSVRNMSIRRPESGLGHWTGCTSVKRAAEGKQLQDFETPDCEFGILGVTLYFTACDDCLPLCLSCVQHSSRWETGQDG
jgi:hypothetical protein